MPKERPEWRARSLARARGFAWERTALFTKSIWRLEGALAADFGVAARCHGNLTPIAPLPPNCQSSRPSHRNLRLPQKLRAFLRHSGPPALKLTASTYGSPASAHPSPWERGREGHFFSAAYTRGSSLSGLAGTDASTAIRTSWPRVLTLVFSKSCCKVDFTAPSVTCPGGAAIFRVVVNHFQHARQNLLLALCQSILESFDPVAMGARAARY